MRFNRYRFSRIRTMLGPIERAVQANVALIIAQAIVVRLSLEIQNADQDDPDILVLLGFLITGAATVVLAVVLYRLIRKLPHRGVRIIALLTSIAVQATAFQLLFAFAA